MTDDLDPCDVCLEWLILGGERGYEVGGCGARSSKKLFRRDRISSRGLDGNAGSLSSMIGIPTRSDASTTPSNDCRWYGVDTASNWNSGGSGESWHRRGCVEVLDSNIALSSVCRIKLSRKSLSPTPLISGMTGGAELDGMYTSRLCHHRRGCNLYIQSRIRRVFDAFSVLTTVCRILERYDALQRD